MGYQSRRRFPFRPYLSYGKKPFWSHICFLFQQSAEKYLKAFILDQGLKFQKTHDLPILLKKCFEKAPGPVDLADDCELLATFYVETRYPVHWPVTFADGDVEQAYQVADRIRSFIRREMNLN